MALTKADVIENPPLSSSTEEDEESGSSGEESSEESESSAAEDSKKEDSDSDSDPEPLKKEKQLGVASGSAVTLPKNSSVKRPLKQAEPEPESEAKKVKISETEHVKKPATDEKAKKISAEDAKKMFQRKFSETDEIAMLQGVLDFTSTKGNASEETDALSNHVKTLIDFDATKVQIQTKLQRLKRKYLKSVKNGLKKGKAEDKIVFSKELDQKAFDLSRKIWGSNGVLTTKAKKKLGGTTPMKETGKPENKVEKTSLSREIDSFINGVNGNAYGLDQSTISAYWENVVEGAKKEEMEGKWKKIQEKQVELCLHRIEFFVEVAKMVLKS